MLKSEYAGVDGDGVNDDNNDISIEMMMSPLVPPSPPRASIHQDSGRCPGPPPRTDRAGGGTTSWIGLGLARTRTSSG